MALKSALLGLLFSINLYYGPSLLLGTPPTVPLQIYSQTDIPYDTDIHQLARELVEYYQKEFPSNIFPTIITYRAGVLKTRAVNGTTIEYYSIHMYRSYNMTVFRIEVALWYFPLNIVIISAIIAPLAFLDSKESPYYTKQMRKTRFYGIAGLYYYDSVMKQWLRERSQTVCSS